MASNKTRREFLQESTTVTAGVALGMAASAGVQAARVRNFDEYRSYDAMGLAELVRDGDASPAQLLDIALARAREVNPGINALVAFYDDIARAAIQRGLPEGPFTGVPWLLKDLGLAMKGTVTTNGSVLFKNAMQDYNSTLVTRYRQAGLVIFGKTHSPEFGGTASTESTLFGDTHNPWNLALSAGGSSGGSAAAVAAGILPAAHASDGGGSIRIPASACGLFGIKPTRGRVPMGPKVYETRNGLSVQHAISRSVRDSAALLDISQGAAIGDAYSAPGRERPYLEEIKHTPGKLRVALMTKPLLPVPVAPDCEVAARQAARLCESLGHSVDEASPVLDVESLFNALSVSSNVLVAKKVGLREQVLGRKARPDELEPITWVGLEAGRKVTGIQYSEVRDVLHHASRVLGHFMEDYDVILSPTMANLPQPLGVLSLNQPFEDFMMVAAAASSFTSLYNMTGQPAMSVPLYWTEGGVPVGVQFAGRFGDEATLFRLAAQLEQASPWFDNVTPA